MITFKQFLAEIDHDDSIFTKGASHSSAKFKLTDEWKKLPLKQQLDSEFELYWKDYQAGYYYKIAVYDPAQKAIAVVVELKAQSLKVPGGTLQGVITTNLLSNEQYRGKGLPFLAYSALINNGQVLISSHEQTSGSRKLWEKLVASDLGEVFVVAEYADARWYMGKEPVRFKPFIGKLERVLISGSANLLNDVAYSTSDTRWLILPKNLDGLNRFKDLAIKLPQVPEELDEEKYVPEWEKPCWIVAINKTLGTKEDKIKELARKAGWDGKSFGAALHQTIQVAWDIIGHMPDLSLTKDAKGMTAKEFSDKTGATGIVFTKGHVMPMNNGKISNFNGHGEEQVIAVATYK